MSRPRLNIVSLQALTYSVTGGVQAYYGITYSYQSVRGSGPLSLVGSNGLSPISFGTPSWYSTGVFATISVGASASGSFGGLTFLVGTGSVGYRVDYPTYGGSSSTFNVTF